MLCKKKKNVYTLANVCNGGKSTDFNSKLTQRQKKTALVFQTKYTVSVK